MLQREAVTHISLAEQQALISFLLEQQQREAAEKAALERQLVLERQSNSGRGQNKIEGHYEYVKKRKWVDTSRNERVWVEERIDGDRRIEGHYEDRNVPSGYWQDYEEKIWIPGHYE